MVLESSLMNWWSKSGVRSSWISALGKPFITPGNLKSLTGIRINRINKEMIN